MFFFQAEDGIRDLVRSRGLGDVYKRQISYFAGYPFTVLLLVWVVVLKWKVLQLEKKSESQDSEISRIKDAIIELKYKKSKDKKKGK